MNSLFWGFLGVIFIRYIHPFIVEKVNMLNVNDLLFLTSILWVIIIIDLITSIIKINNISINLEKLKQISNTIKEKLEELEAKQINKESLLQAIEELKYKQTNIKRKLLKQTNRLKKAFPTMKSEVVEKINEFLKEKKENLLNRRS